MASRLERFVKELRSDDPVRYVLEAILHRAQSYRDEDAKTFVQRIIEPHISEIFVATAPDSQDFADYRYEPCPPHLLAPFLHRSETADLRQYRGRNIRQQNMRKFRRRDEAEYVLEVDRRTNLLSFFEEDDREWAGPTVTEQSIDALIVEAGDVHGELDQIQQDLRNLSQRSKRCYN